MKALTTGMGESTSDFLVHKLVPEIAVVLGGIGLLVALVLQFRADAYVALRDRVGHLRRDQPDSRPLFRCLRGR